MGKGYPPQCDGLCASRSRMEMYSNSTAPTKATYSDFTAATKTTF